MTTPNDPLAGGGIGPEILATQASSKAYEQELRRLVLDPFVRRIQRRIDSAGQHYGAIRQSIRDIPEDPSLEGLSREAARAQAERLKAKHTAEFTRKMSRYLGVNVGPMMPEIGLERIMTQFVADNVDLIKTIPPRYHTKLTADLAKLAADAPFDQQQLTRLLKDSYESSGYNLRRLSRDQTNKLIGQFNQKRQEQLGIQEYLWQTSEDERVRPTHEIKNQQIFRWDSPPPDTGHPGQDIQCRCSAKPIIPGIQMRPTAPPRINPR